MVGADGFADPKPARLILFWGPSSVFFLHQFPRKGAVTPKLGIVALDQFERFILGLSVGQVKEGTIGIFGRDDSLRVGEVGGILRRVAQVEITVAVFSHDAVVFQGLDFTGTQAPVGGNLEARLLFLRLGGRGFLINIKPDGHIHLDRLRSREIDRGRAAAQPAGADEKPGQGKLSGGETK